MSPVARVCHMNANGLWNVIIFCFLNFIFVFSTMSVSGEEPKKEPSSESSIKTLNNIVIDPVKKEIRMRAKLAILDGILEFFLVDEAGQTYESVFKIIDNKPSELHFGLLFLGFTPVTYDMYRSFLDQKDGLESLRKKNCLLEIQIYQKGKAVPLSSIIRNREKTGDQKLTWVFTGGAFDAENQYAPDLADIYISIWPEIASVINLFSTAGNPYRGDVGYEMVKDIPFTMEDEFTIIIRGAK